MSSRLRLAVNHAIGVIEEYIRSRKLRPGDELPTSQALASIASVSRVTMWAALNQLKRQGRLDGVAGHPFRVGSGQALSGDSGDGIPSSVTGASPLQSTAWKRTLEAIQQDILKGTFAPGTILASVKELGHRYGVTYKTLRKALEAMVADGAIQRSKRGYAVPALSVYAKHSRIICLTHSYDSFTMHLAQHDEELFRSLEKQCMNARISLDVFLIFPESLVFKTAPHHLLRDRRSGHVYEVEDLTRFNDPAILGFVLLIPGKPQELESRLLHALPQKKPVSILVESATWSLPHDLARTRPMRVFTITASQEPARALARYLLSLGHRKTAYISAYHQFAWSQMRLDGLVSAYTASGLRDGVAAFTAQTNLDEGVPLDRFLKSYEAFRKTLPAPQHIDFDAMIYRMKRDTAYAARLRTSLYPLLEQALAQSRFCGITAWVLVNDHSAFMALEFLAARGVETPGQMSVISFDDAVDALRVNLTSYNFNAAGVAMAMLGYILNRKPFTYVDGKRVSEVRGYIVERQTTGPASTKSILP